MNAKDLKENIKTFIEQLANEVDEVKRSALWQSWLDTQSKFYNYSVNNAVLILWSRPDATKVAGYNQWIKGFKRFVKKGEHGIPILAPLLKKDKETGESTCYGFRTVYVFDVAQTDGEPLPEIAWFDNVKVAEVERKLIDWAAKQGIVVEISLPESSTAQGAAYVNENRIALKASSSTETLIHEIAHKLLHCGERETTREQREVEAESVAYIICKIFGFGATTCATYLAGWGTAEAIRGSMDAIYSAVKTISAAIDGKAVEEVTAE